MKEVVISSAVRTPIGSFQGILAPLSAPELGAVAIREAVRRAGAEPDQVERAYMGCVLTGGLGQAPARQAAIKAGQTLSREEMRELIRQLEQAERPGTCPHGRPTMIHLSQVQLEREFGRG